MQPGLEQLRHRLPLNRTRKQRLLWIVNIDTARRLRLSPLGRRFGLQAQCMKIGQEGTRSTKEVAHFLYNVFGTTGIFNQKAWEWQFCFELMTF